jgi:ATP-dependent protease ClpP protease subunit
VANKVKIKGVIIPNDYKWVYDWFDMDSTCPNDVSKVLETLNNEEVEVEINSGGGDVYSGSEIYTALKDYKGNKVVKIVGIAASAASIVAMAGDKVLISPTAQIMIHNVSSTASGDYRDLEHEAEVIKNYNSTIVNAYTLKTGMKKNDLLEMMNKETWLTPEKALEYKFVDEIMFQEESRMVASYNNMIPIEVINKIRNTVKGPINSENGESDILMSKYNYLKLKGECKDEF